MKDKLAFGSEISSYLKNGVMVPIYASDRLAVLRVADSFYVATDYTKGKHGFVAFLVNSKMIRAMMVDESFLEQMIASSDRETLASMMFELDRNTFQRFRGSSKNNLVSDLQHRFVDEKMEQWIIDTYGKPDMEIPETGKQGFLGLFRNRK